MQFEDFKSKIKTISAEALPGEASQFKMSPPFRADLIEANKLKMKTARKAGVMALFYPNSEGETYLILILRKTYRGVHSAQVGFPGGKHELEDPDLKYTALRETFEEVGVPIESMELIRALTPMYIPPSHFTVSPFLGITSKTPAFIKQDEEVEDLIEVSLSDFLDDKNTTTVEVMTSLEKELTVPAFILNGYIVWGATAMMLSELKDLLKIVL